MHHGIFLLAILHHIELNKYTCLRLFLLYKPVTTAVNVLTRVRGGTGHLFEAHLKSLLPTALYQSPLKLNRWSYIESEYFLAWFNLNSYIVALCCIVGAWQSFVSPAAIIICNAIPFEVFAIAYTLVAEFGSLCQTSTLKPNQTLSTLGDKHLTLILFKWNNLQSKPITLFLNGIFFATKLYTHAPFELRLQSSTLYKTLLSLGLCIHFKFSHTGFCERLFQFSTSNQSFNFNEHKNRKASEKIIDTAYFLPLQVFTTTTKKRKKKEK